MRADLIHPYGDGGKIIATLLTNELLAGLARFKTRLGSENPAVVMPKSSAPEVLGATPRDSMTVDLRPIPPSSLRPAR